MRKGRVHTREKPNGICTNTTLYKHKKYLSEDEKAIAEEPLKNNKGRKSLRYHLTDPRFGANWKVQI